MNELPLTEAQQGRNTPAEDTRMGLATLLCNQDSNFPLEKPSISDTHSPCLLSGNVPSEPHSKSGTRPGKHNGSHRPMRPLPGEYDGVREKEL
jgi:hypothetical protein